MSEVVIPTLVVILLAAIVIHATHFYRPFSTFCKGIPAVGYSGYFTGYLGVLRFWLDAPSMLQEGHKLVSARTNTQIFLD